MNNIFWATRRMLMTDVRVRIVVHGNTDFLKRIAKRLCSVHVLPLNGDSVEVELQYPNYKSASRACRNFARNNQIESVDLIMSKGFK